MDPVVKEAWCQALESGKYKQGWASLRTGLNNPKYCCLGVLCDLGGKKDWTNLTNGHFGYGRSRDGFPPKNVRELAGVSLSAMRQVAAFNDGQHVNGGYEEKKTFPEIAQWIRENL